MSNTEKREYPLDPLALQRVEVCKQCTYYAIEDEARCNLCGCVIKKLVNDEVGTCPVGKW